MEILFYILAVLAGAVLALCIYIPVRKMILKGQKEDIIRKAEIDAENIKKEKIFQAKEKFLQLKSEHEQYINEKSKQNRFYPHQAYFLFGAEFPKYSKNSESGDKTKEALPSAKAFL